MADVYEHDLRDVVSLIEWIDRHDPDGDLIVTGGSLTLENRHGYPVGTLSRVDGQWKFTPEEAGASATG